MSPRGSGGMRHFDPWSHLDCTRNLEQLAVRGEYCWVDFDFSFANPVMNVLLVKGVRKVWISILSEVRNFAKLNVAWNLLALFSAESPLRTFLVIMLSRHVCVRRGWLTWVIILSAVTLVKTLWLLGGGWKVLRVDVCQKQKVQVSDQLFAETSLSRPFGEIKVLALKVESKRST